MKKGYTEQSDSAAVLPDQASAVLLAATLRTQLLRLQQMGIASVPVTDELRAFLRPPRQQRTSVQARLQHPPVAAKHQASTKVRPPVPAQPVFTDKDLDTIRQDIATCRNCALGGLRQRLSTGQGNIHARLLVVGDFAMAAAAEDTIFGAEEDHLFWKMMQAIALQPADVYVTNAVKCVPGDAGMEMLSQAQQECRVYVQREITLVQPKVILAMGAAAVSAVLGQDGSVVRLRGQLRDTLFKGVSGQHIPVMVSFHPRLLLKQQEMKKAAWHDLQIVQRALLAAA